MASRRTYSSEEIISLYSQTHPCSVPSSLDFLYVRDPQPPLCPFRTPRAIVAPSQPRQLSRPKSSQQILAIPGQDDLTYPPGFGPESSEEDRPEPPSSPPPPAPPPRASKKPTTWAELTLPAPAAPSFASVVSTPQAAFVPVGVWEPPKPVFPRPITPDPHASFETVVRDPDEPPERPPIDRPGRQFIGAWEPPRVAAERSGARKPSFPIVITEGSNPPKVQAPGKPFGSGRPPVIPTPDLIVSPPPGVPRKGRSEVDSRQVPIDVTKIVTPVEGIAQSNRPQVVFGAIGQARAVNGSKPVSFNPANFAVPTGRMNEADIEFTRVLARDGFYIAPPM